MTLHGIHHLTAVTADARRNHDFYTRVLGMRLVKKTVNQDDTSAYHLFYADGAGSPGTDLTFFDWPTGPERRGTDAIVRTSLRVAGRDALDYWAARLGEAGVKHRPVREVDGRLRLDFEDPEGQRLALVDDGAAGPFHPWDRSPVPEARQVRGLGPIAISVPDLGPSDAFLTEVMAMRRVRSYADPDAPGTAAHVYEMGEGGPAAELHVQVEPGLPRARLGAGGGPHVAFRVRDAGVGCWAARRRRRRGGGAGATGCRRTAPAPCPTAARARPGC